MGYTFIDKQEELDSIIPKLMANITWAVDTETTGLDPHTDKIVLLQIGNLDDQYLIDVRKVRIEPLREFLASEHIRKIAHNGKFDYKMLRGNANICTERICDTYLAEKVLAGGSRKWGFGLDDLVKKYLDKQLDKSLQKSFKQLGDITEEQKQYAAEDIISVFKVLQMQCLAMEKNGHMNTWRLECAALPCFGDMEFDGVYLDQEKWGNNVAENLIKAANVLNVLDDISNKVMGTTVDWNSPKQVVTLLQNLRIKVDGQLIQKSDEATLVKVRDGNPIVSKLKEYRSLTKRIGTFGQSYIKAIHPVTGRIHPEFDQIGTATGRIASRGEVTFLGIPKDNAYRNCFHGESNEVIETHDYSSCELRIWAELSNDKVLMKIFREGRDAHCAIGSTLFGVDIQKGSPERELVKTLNFAILFGIGHKTLHDKSGKGTIEETKQMYDSYCELLRSGVRYIREMGRAAQIHKELTNIGGRTRYWNCKDDNIALEGGNFMTQSVNADMTKLAMVNIRQCIKRHGFRAKFVNQVYDEIVTRTHEDDSPNFSFIKKNLMIEAAHYYLRKVPMEVESKIARFWTK